VLRHVNGDHIVREPQLLERLHSLGSSEDDKL
jgi:hypothetical protein